MIDLRSDTVTKPTPAMREAMARAEVGDDVYGEDPTVNRLEEEAAAAVGKQAALFVPTGTMGNTIAIKLHTEHGQEVICEARAHILNYELSMMAWFAGCVARPVAAPRGILSWDRIAPEVRPLGPHWAPTGLIEIENTHNMAGGTVYPLAVIRAIAQNAHALGLAVHMDGARLFNAAASLNETAAAIAEPVDTVMFCLSKALGAPVGSILAGPRALIDKGRLYRKRLGGGMRQAGILAAAGLMALREMPLRLGADHANARAFAEAIARIPGVVVEGPVESNIVIFQVAGDREGTDKPAHRVSAALKERGVLLNPISATRLRAVTHYDVSAEDCLTGASILEDVLKL